MADAKRVALLARPGEACERLRAALREAGGDIVLEADPSTLAAEALSAAAPQTVLVALDPAVEDALDRFDAVLGDPAVAVIYDEADLAARREGWDAARWVRHLSAKLHRHADVLPPGREPDEGGASAPAEVVTPKAEVTPVATASAGFDAPEAATVELPEMAVVRISVAEASAVEAPEAFSGLALAEEAPASFSGLALTDDINEMSLDGEAGASRFEGALEFDTLLAGLAEESEIAPEAEPFEAALDDVLSAAPDMALDVVAELPPIEVTELTFEAEPPPAPVTPAAASAQEKPSFDFGALSLVDQDDAPAVAETPGQGGRFQHDIAELERRIASMGLSEGPEGAQPAAATPEAASLETATFETATFETPTFETPTFETADVAAAPSSMGTHAGGAVLILAGIGGPDAVRQILSALPANFARPVLISQRLDGGRYDRLVQQMARAAALPVQLAQAGTAVGTGNVYIVPPELGLDRGDGLRFAPGAALLAALPADDSAVLLLSGADPAQVDDALAKAAEGALVAGQSPEGCYDAAAPIALTSRGGSAAAPSELVQRLLQRWPA